MARYFLEVAYAGAAYSGFQVQKNANSIQAEVEKAFLILQRTPVEMTGSSRTDAGVHALQNFFHFDVEGELHEQFVYKMNAILPRDIVIKSIRKMPDTAHCRFDAEWREYRYHVYRSKDPFKADRAFYFPYTIDMDLLQEAATVIKEYDDFTSFSKRNTQVKTFECNILSSRWLMENDEFIYEVRANRFLRGMVRALTATMLAVGRKKISLDEFRSIIESKNCTKASFAVPAHGLFLMKVAFADVLI